VKLCRENTTSLHAAINMNHVDMARLLLQFGADVNARARFVILGSVVQGKVLHCSFQFCCSS